MIEIWKPVPYEPFDSKYVVSNLGRVKPIKKSKYSPAKSECLRNGVGARGYCYVTLYHNGIAKQCSVHRMVAICFVGAAPNGKNVVCHIDDNRLNNVADNLEWGDNYDNMQHMREHGRSLVGSKHPRALLDDFKVLSIRKLHADGEFTRKELAVKFDISYSVVCQIVRGVAWRHI